MSFEVPVVDLAPWVDVAAYDDEVAHLHDVFHHVLNCAPGVVPPSTPAERCASHISDVSNVGGPPPTGAPRGNSPAGGAGATFAVCRMWVGHRSPDR